MTRFRNLFFKCCVRLFSSRSIWIIVVVQSSLLAVICIIFSSVDTTNYDCHDVINETYARICTNYRKGIFVGALCESLCSGNIELLDCPSVSLHSGKEVIILAADHHGSLIIKSQVFMIEELLPEPMENFLKSNSTFKIASLVMDRVGGDNLPELYRLLSPFPRNELNQTELLNLWMLIQQNEYVLSKTRDSLFPAVISTCGHFYSVHFLDQIIDWTFFVPPVYGFKVNLPFVYIFSNCLFF